jgi:hypothetical protein
VFGVADVRMKGAKLPLVISDGRINPLLLGKVEEKYIAVLDLAIESRARGLNRGRPARRQSLAK